MSAPNTNAPNEGLVGQAVNSVSNAANYVSETIQGKSAEASKEANKEQAKGNVRLSSITILGDSEHLLTLPLEQVAGQDLSLIHI